MHRVPFLYNRARGTALMGVTVEPTMSRDDITQILHELRDGASGAVETLLPVLWSDNDVTLWPGESETMTARYDPADLAGATPVVEIFGWNVARRLIPAPEAP